MSGDTKPTFAFGPNSADAVGFAIDAIARWSGNKSLQRAAEILVENLVPVPPPAASGEGLTNATIARLWAEQRRAGGTSVQRRRRFARAIAALAVELASRQEAKPSASPAPAEDPR